MDDHHARLFEPTETVRYRAAEARDGVAMWRLKRACSREPAASPFFYMALLQRLAGGCVAAELAGELIGFVIARPSESGVSARVVDMAIDPAHDPLAVTAGMLAQLVRMPAHEQARFIEAEPDANRAVVRLIDMARTLPLAKASERDAGMPRAFRAQGW